MISATALLLLAPIGGILAAIGPVTDLHIQNAFLQPDGFNRSFVTAEGTIPGPLITGNIGDNFQINVIDELTNDTMLLSTSIHWHGLFQATTSWADGPSFVNQCPIAANNSFLYDFNVPGQAGTFWYHSHLATQYCDGLRGALVIYDPNDPYLNDYDVDDDSTVITLSDHYHVPAGLIVGAAKSDATLINGLGRAFVTGPADAPLAVVAVTHGLRYRFRLVSISCDPSYVFSIDQHTFSFIEVDGVLHEAVTADSVQIFAAQRYSFILTANQTIGNYWIKADPRTNPGSGFANGINSAILRYASAPVAEPTSVGNPSNQLNETSLHPLVNPGAPGEDNVNGAQHPLNLVLGFSAGRFEINNVSFVPPSVPVLLQIISGTLDAADLLPAGSVYELPLNSSIQLTFDTSAAVGGPHPFHLHGHNFDVIRPAGSTEYNYVNPVRRDVVSTGNTLNGDNVTIRFTTDNAGPWFLHCHIDFHLEAGFAIVFAEGINSIAAPAAAKPPQDWDQLCPIYNNLTTAQLGGGGGPTT